MIRLLEIQKAKFTENSNYHVRKILVSFDSPFNNGSE